MVEIRINSLLEIKYMKTFATLFIIFISIHTYGQEYYFINAKNGLNVRSNSNLSSTKVAKIPFGVMVEKIADTDKYLTVEDNGKQIKGKFIKIRYNNYLYLVSEETKPFEREGYVFDGYLKKQKDKNLISTVKIEKAAYNKLLRSVSKKENNPKKIGNLDSIKTILKNHVKWSNNDKSDDFIKSITTKNGQKLLLNYNSNDYGFSEGESGYFPEYDILVLEGGHSSDMCFSIKTGETHFTIGNPEYIISSPKGTYRLNGSFGGQECISYFFQKNENENFIYLTEFGEDYDICTFKEFYWINETIFIYKILDYTTDSVNGTEEYFKGEIKNNTTKNVQTPNKGVIITKIDSLKYSKKICCILSPEQGFTAYNKPNGKVIGKIKRIGSIEKNDQFAYEIYFVSENENIKLTDYVQVGYEILALTFTESIDGFVKIKNQTTPIWFSVDEVKQLGFKVVNWIDYMVLNSKKVLGYYAKEPGLRIRTEPNNVSKIIGSVQGDLFEIKLTKNISGQWAKVKITKHKEHPCNTDLDKEANIEYKTEGWMKIIDDNGEPNLWSYGKGC